MYRALTTKLLVLRRGSALRRTALILLALTTSSAGVLAHDAYLFTDVRIFDGRSHALSLPTRVLVQGNTITAIGNDIASGNAKRIAGQGRTLMPGLIDAHWHAMMSDVSMRDGLSVHPGYIHIVAAKAAEATLQRGFTSVRDMAGPVWGLKQAIDRGITSGPRIWPAGAMISQTSGHGDYRSAHDLPRTPSSPPHFTETLGVARIADGVDEVRRAVREQLMQGASHIKLAAGGGVSSNFDPLDVTQYSEEEVRAAVEAAEDWGTYVAVHAYTPRAVQMALRAGVKVIEHGQLIDETTAKMIAKQVQMRQGTDTAYTLAKKHRLKTAWGTDTLFDTRLAARQGAQLAKMTRWYTPAEVLVMATSNNAELLALSGNRTPYPGKLGIVEVGALADLLLVDGDPTADLSLLANPAQKLLVIMKDGQIYKDLTKP